VRRLTLGDALEAEGPQDVSRGPDAVRRDQHVGVAVRARSAVPVQEPVDRGPLEDDAANTRVAEGADDLGRGQIKAEAAGGLS
jgi:hypothetical protein